MFMLFFASRISLIQRIFSYDNFIMIAFENHFLELGKNPVRFDPVGEVTNVFFDESNSQVFAVRSGGGTGVVVKGPTERIGFTFILKDRGPLISIKFSYQHKVLAMQRNDRSVEFSNFENGETDPIEYSQTCKGRNNKILTFHWISTNEIIFVTENGVEFYQLNTEKRFLKLIKNHTLTVHWSVFSPEASVLLTSSGPGNLLVPFFVKNGQITRLQKFEAETSRNSNKLQERDVTLLSLYNTLYAGILRHAGSGERCSLDLFLLNRDSPVRKSFILQLGLIGRFAINVVDNLVVAHHQVSKTSTMFDVKLPGVSRSNAVNLEPMLPPLPIKPFHLKTRDFDVKSGMTSLEKECDLYAHTWIVFRPNLIIDAALGCMWHLKINLPNLAQMFQDQSLLVDFLLLRRQSRPTVLEVMKKALSSTYHAPIAQVRAFFSKLNQVYKDYIDAEHYYAMKVQNQPDSNPIPHHRDWVVLDQNDIFAQVLEPMVENVEVPGSYKVAAITEYVRSLDSFKITAKHFIYELLIRSLIHEQGYFHLQQLLRHKVIEDSKPVACLLLSLESVHPPCFELALDMLKRLATSDEQVIEVMLSKQMILPALRYIRHVGMHDLVPARKFLAASQHDDQLFFSVYKFFEARNLRLNGKPEFMAAERCNEYMDYYVSRFVADVVQ